MRALLLLIVLALTSCSKHEEAQSLINEIHTASLVESDAIQTKATLACADAASCPESVGLFLASSPDSAVGCTAFLIGQDLAATNTHCIPSAVKMLPDLCADRVQLVLPATGKFPEERFQCKEMVSILDRPNSISPDLAVFRLDHATTRTALTVDPTGVEPGAAFTAYKVNPTTLTSGLVVKQTCVSVADTYRFPLYHFREDAIFVVADCPSMAGNSGSPLLNTEGRAVGIFQVALPYTEEQKKVWQPHLKAGEDFAPLALGTSLRCLNNTCLPNDEEEIVRPTIEDFLGKLDFTAIALPLEKYFEWQAVPLIRHALERQETYEPRCFKPAEGWIGEVSLFNDPVHYYAGVNLPVEIPTVRAQMLFNRYLQSSAELTVLSLSRQTLNFDPETLLDSGGSIVSLSGGFTNLLTSCSGN